MKPLLAVFLLIITLSCSQPEKDNGKKTVFVSILPQKFFAEQIVGKDFNVEVMVGPGQNPHTFEPSPAQMAAIAQASIFFRIGLSFEDAWLNKLIEVNPELNVLDTRAGIELLDMKEAEEIQHSEDTVPADSQHTEHENHHIENDEHNHNHIENDEHNHHHGEKDPHIWLSPELVKKQAETLCDAFIILEPKKQAVYKSNLIKFQTTLDSLSADINKTISLMKNKKILVFHPSWGYFADEFGIEQIPIEISGKSPSPIELTYIINYAKKENIRVIFAQEQFSSREAEAVALEINGKVIKIDPLAYDYVNNLSNIAKVFSEEMSVEE